jgi:anti-anti-sigma factor
MRKDAPARADAVAPTTTCTSARQRGVFLITVTGDLDFAAVGRAPLRSAVSSYRSDEPLDVVLDLGDVTILDSSGLTWLMSVRSAAALADRRVRLRRSSPLVDRVLEMAGLARYFPAEPRPV